MPELPEVEVVRRGIDAHVVGAVIERVEVFEPRSVRRHAGGPAQFADELVGLKVASTGRRGKFMWLVLTPDGADHIALMIHLGMSGQVRVFPEKHVDHVVGATSEGQTSDGNKHVRIRLHTRRPTGTVRADFVDQRIFGGMWLCDLGPDTQPTGAPSGTGAVGAGVASAIKIPTDAAHVARDVLDPQLDREGVVRRVQRSQSAIKRLLLDQGVVSGIGNIYADEALWAAQVHGEQPGATLTAAQVRALLDAAGEVMNRALTAGGTSFDALYVNVDGRQGYFARSLEAYGKTGEPCSRCGALIEREVIAARSSHFCPRCQVLRSCLPQAPSIS